MSLMFACFFLPCDHKRVESKLTALRVADQDTRGWWNCSRVWSLEPREASAGFTTPVLLSYFLHMPSKFRKIVAEYVRDLRSSHKPPLATFAQNSDCVQNRNFGSLCRGRERQINIFVAEHSAVICRAQFHGDSSKFFSRSGFAER